MDHSPIGFSGLAGWGPCSGRINFCKDIPRTTSVYAEEGTAAHEVGEVCLKDGSVPSDRIGKVFNKFKVTKEMAEAVDVYVEAVKLGAKGKNLKIEQGFKLTWLHPDLWGTNDACAVLEFESLDVWDYKHGKGIAVEVVKYSDPVNDFEEKTFAIFGCLPNYQMMGYALGAVGEGNENCVVSVTMHVVQPRALHADGAIRSFTIEVNDLIKWGNEVLLPAALATESLDASLVPGPWCRTSFCPGQGGCPALAEEALSQAHIEFQDLHNPPVHTDFLPIAMLSDEQLGKIVCAEKMIKAFVDEAVKTAKYRADSGNIPDGCKLVKGRAPAKKWRPDVEQTIVSMAQNFTIDPYADPKLKTPTQMLKEAKDSGIDADPMGTFEPLFEMAEAGTKLVPLSASGTPIASKAHSDFDDLI